MATAEKRIRHETPPNRPLEQVLTEAMNAVSASQNCTKRTAVRLAISNTIQEGVLAPGDYLPSEAALTTIMGVSLGTVQAALQQLQDIGAVIRRRGDGTRVTGSEPHPAKVWHFRFLSKTDGQALRMGVEDIRFEECVEPGFWSDFLGDDKPYLRIVRRIVLRGGIPTGAEMYLPRSLASGLEGIDISELEMVNIRPFLETHLGLTITARNHIVRLTEPSRAERSEFALTASGPFFEILAQTWSSERKPVYCQRILVAACDCDLNF